MAHTVNPRTQGHPGLPKRKLVYKRNRGHTFDPSTGDDTHLIPAVERNMRQEVSAVPAHPEV